MPSAFGRLQPLEFMQLWDGYQWRKEQRENELAYFTAASMSVHVKGGVAPSVLLEPLRKPVRNKKDDEQYLREKFKGKLPGGD